MAAVFPVCGSHVTSSLRRAWRSLTPSLSFRIRQMGASTRMFSGFCALLGGSMISVSRGRRGTSSGLPLTLPARAEALSRAPPLPPPPHPPNPGVGLPGPGGGGGPRLVAFTAGLPWAQQVHAGAGAAAGRLRQSLRSAVAASEPRTRLAKARQQRHRCAFSPSTDGHVGNELQVSKTLRRPRDGGSEARVPPLPACRPGSSPGPCGPHPLR